VTEQPGLPSTSHPKVTDLCRIHRLTLTSLRYYLRAPLPSKGPPMLPRILSRTSILRICAFIGVSTVTCLAQYTGPGAVASTSLDFGPVAVNARSAIQSVTFSFAESETIAHIRVGASGTNGQDFHYAGGTCKVGDSFSVNQQCTMKVTFLPDHVGEGYRFLPGPPRRSKNSMARTR
jgi:hypothetical protein